MQLNLCIKLCILIRQIAPEVDLDVDLVRRQCNCLWIDALQPTDCESMPPTSSGNNRRRARTGSSEAEIGASLKAVRGAGAKFLKSAADGMGKAKAQANRAAASGMKKARNAKDVGMKSIRSGAGIFIRCRSWQPMWEPLAQLYWWGVIKRPI